MPIKLIKCGKIKPELYVNNNYFYIGELNYFNTCEFYILIFKISGTICCANLDSVKI